MRQRAGAVPLLGVFVLLGVLFSASRRTPTQLGPEKTSAGRRLQLPDAYVGQTPLDCALACDEGYVAVCDAPALADASLELAAKGSKRHKGKKSRKSRKTRKKKSRKSRKSRKGKHVAHHKGSKSHGKSKGGKHLKHGKSRKARKSKTHLKHGKGRKGGKAHKGGKGRKSEKVAKHGKGDKNEHEKDAKKKHGKDEKHSKEDDRAIKEKHGKGNEDKKEHDKSGKQGTEEKHSAKDKEKNGKGEHRKTDDVAKIEKLMTAVREDDVAKIAKLLKAVREERQHEAKIDEELKQAEEELTRAKDLAKSDHDDAFSDAPSTGHSSRPSEGPADAATEAPSDGPSAWSWGDAADETPGPVQRGRCVRAGSLAAVLAGSQTRSQLRHARPDFEALELSAATFLTAMHKGSMQTPLVAAACGLLLLGVAVKVVGRSAAAVRRPDAARPLLEIAEPPADVH